MPDNKEEPRVKDRNAWRRWFALWIPLMVLVEIARSWMDFNVIMGVMLAVLAGVLIYQRYVNNRSWRSIMWGVHVRDE